jgi:hypothetical protein
MKVLAFCPRCGKQQECFDDVSWKKDVEAYKFVCSCLTETHFTFPETIGGRKRKESSSDWLKKDLKS